MATIYMPLLNEGVDVWRPVEATPLSPDTYRVAGGQPEDEEWAFGSGSVVHCAWTTLSSGNVLAVIGIADLQEIGSQPANRSLTSDECEAIKQRSFNAVRKSFLSRLKRLGLS